MSAMIASCGTLIDDNISILLSFWLKIWWA